MAQQKLVRYVSPFGSPAHMPREVAERYLREDDDLWCELQAVERETGQKIIADFQRKIGPPRIES